MQNNVVPKNWLFHNWICQLVCFGACVCMCCLCIVKNWPHPMYFLRGFSFCGACLRVEATKNFEIMYSGFVRFFSFSFVHGCVCVLVFVVATSAFFPFSLSIFVVVVVCSDSHSLIKQNLVFGKCGNQDEEQYGSVAAMESIDSHTHTKTKTTTTTTNQITN